VDDAVAGTQRDTATGADEAGQFAMHAHVRQLRAGGGVAEGLHHHVGRETEAGQILQFVACHRAGGVLRADGRRPRFAVGSGQDALTFRQTAGATDHLLRQRVALARVARCKDHPPLIAELELHPQGARVAWLSSSSSCDPQAGTSGQAIRRSGQTRS